MDYFEQIEAYLNNTLSESEKLAFERAMESDAKLKQAVDDHSIAMDVVGSILEDEVRKVIEDEMLINNGGEEGELIINNEKLIINNGEEAGDGGKVDSAAIKRINWMRWVAAAIVVFVVGWWGMGELSGIDDSKLYSEIYYDPSWPSERGDEETELSKTIIKYLTGNKEAAKLKLLEMRTEESNYWLSEIYLKEMKFDSTLLFLPEALKTESNNKRDRINYLNILSLYFNDSKAKSEEAFKNLPEDTDGFYDPIYKELAF